MKTRYTVTAVAMAIAANGAGAASIESDSANIQQASADIENIVVVSSRVATPLRQIATSVSVVTATDIETQGYASLAEVLRAQPAISVTNSGGIGTTTALRIRGEEGFRTLVRIDGVDISDPTGPQVAPPLAHLLSDNIARVEILRGTQGLMYGADAGGVINVDSGGYQDDLFGRVSAEAGRYETDKLTAAVGGGAKAVDYYLSAVDYSTDGYNSRTDDVNGDADSYDNTTLHARVGYQASDQLSLQVVARRSEGDGEFDACGFGDTFSNDCSSSFEQLNMRASMDYRLGASAHQLALASTDIKRENFNQGNSSFLTEGDVKRAEYLGHTDFDANSRVIYGVDWEQERITSADLKRQQTGYYAEYQTEWLTDLFLTAGLRYDDNDDFGDHTSYRISGAYLWPMGDGELKLRSAYGTGFRAPSLFEIDYNQGPFAFAPASETQLTEELTEGYEVGLEYTQGIGTHYQIIFFDQKITDGIYFDLAGFSGYLQDQGTAYSQGVELIADVDISANLRVNFNYTYNDTEDSAGSQRARRPRHLANLSVSYQWQQWQLATKVRLVSDIVDANVELDDYEIMDLTARYTVNEQLAVSARLENIFDTQYQDIATFNTAGRAGYLKLSYEF